MLTALMQRDAPPIPQANREAIGRAIGRIPSGLFILTAAHEDRRMGTLVSWVQQCCFEPLMVTVALAKGRSIMPLISDSRRFALCQLGEEDRLTLRRFSGGTDSEGDPFLGMELLHSVAAPELPVLAGTLTHLVCEVAVHMDVEGDHDVFVGRVLEARCGAGEPKVHLRTTGLKY